MINLEQIKKEKCQSPPPFSRRSAPAPYFHPLFLLFQSTPFLKGEGGGVVGDPNYVGVYFPFSGLFIGEGRA